MNIKGLDQASTLLVILFAALFVIWSITIINVIYLQVQVNSLTEMAGSLSRIVKNNWCITLGVHILEHKQNDWIFQEYRESCYT